LSGEDEKYESLRAKLRALPKVKAKSGFEERLFSRIRETERQRDSRKASQESFSIKEWLLGVFSPSFIPVAGVAVVLIAAIFVYYAYFAVGNKTENDQSVFTSAPYQKQGEFVIYVRKDTSSYPKNEIASLDKEERPGTIESRNNAGINPSNVSSDYESRTLHQKFAEPKTDIPTDRIETRGFNLELSKPREAPTMKGDEQKRSDDLEEEKKEAPSNYMRNKDEDTGKNENNGDSIDGIITNQSQIQTEKAPLQIDSVTMGKRLSKSESKTSKDTLKVDKSKVLTPEENDTNSNKK